MKKMKTMFEREFEGHKIVAVHPKLVPGCEFVLGPDCVPTRKLDGTACMICSRGKVYKRYDCKKGRTAPDNFVPCDDPDPVTGHWPGWVPAENDAIVLEGLYNSGLECVNPFYTGSHSIRCAVDIFEPFTCELVGPKVNGNNDGFPFHMLIPHGTVVLNLERGYVRSKDAVTQEQVLFDKVRQYLEKNVIEGIVFHGPNREMCKIKRSDFGLPWGRPRT